jgi:hypothetical protein
MNRPSTALRRLAHGGLAGIAMLLLAAATVAGADLTDRQIIDRLAGDQRSDRAIAKAIDFLRTQVRPDGMVGMPRKHDTAMTALVVMAHLSAGITTDHRERGPWLRQAITGVLDRQDADGYLGSVDNSRMYGHGIATLMLAEVLGTTRDEDLDRRLRLALERAVQVTVDAARVRKDDRNRGGWRYQPSAKDSDLSLSGWQLMSLVAARQVGIAVPDEVVLQAVAYARRLIGEDGSVGYDKVGDDHPALRGLAVLALAIAPGDAAADRRLMARIADRIQRDPLTYDGKWVLYRAHYDAIGLSKAMPEVWDVYGPRLQRTLIDAQQADGSWPPPPQSSEEGQQGPAYTTAMAVLSLAVDRHVLPAFQR